MTIYGDIPGAEIAIDQAVKSSTATKFRDNPLSVFEGDPTAKAAGKALAIEFDSGGGSQTGILTDETDVDKVLTPDGVDGAKWSVNPSGMILLERKEIAAATTTVSFAGLDGDVDEVYKLIGRINRVVGGSVVITLRPNGLGTNQSMRLVIDGAAATNVAILRIIQAGVVAPTFLTFELLLHARETIQAQAMPRTILGKSSEFDPNVMSRISDFAGTWFGAGNIISLDIQASVASAIGIGSTFELFKLTQ